MSSVVPDASGSASEEPSWPHAAYTAELKAACRSLGADESDLQHLLAPLQEAQVPLQQLYGLLKQSWSRLKALRESQADLAEFASEQPETVRLVEQGFEALQRGEAFSLEQSDRLFERACELSHTREVAARVRSLQAEIAAIQLDYHRAAELSLQAALTPGLDAPLQWRYQFQRARALEEQGLGFMDEAALEETVGLYETRVLALASRERWPDEWAATQHHLGDALGALGQRQRGTRLLERAIEAFENALSVESGERDPADRAAIYNSLGNTLGILAQRHADTEMLERSVSAFESALEVRTREREPQDWAVTQNNYAAALLTLGQRKQDKTILKRASDAYKKVLQVWTRERGPLDWAATMDNLGTALRLLGEHRKGPRTLEQSVAAYRSAISERTRDRVPREWAMTQNNLGAALHRLGMRAEDPQHLESAIEAYENALKELTRERGWLAWAMTRANLAAARKALAELSGEIDLVRAALSDLQAVAGVFRDASHAQYYELVTEQIALLRKLEQRIQHAERA